MGSATPLVSVIMPTHNRATLLGRAVRSVLSQTYDNLELIVVDDASTDNTPEVMRTFTDPRIRYIRLEKNGRAAAARNAAIKVSRGELLAFQDDDDEWLDRKLERQVAMLMRAPAEVGLNFCGFNRLDEGGVRYFGGADMVRQIDFTFPPYWARDFSLISTPNWLLRRSVLDRAGLFDERFKSIDDWELAVRIFEVCRTEHLDEALWIQHRHRVAGSGMVNNTSLILGDYKILLQKYAERWRPHVLARFCFQIARFQIEARDPEMVRWLKETLRYQAFHPKAWLFLALALGGPEAPGFAIGLRQKVQRAWERVVAGRGA